MDYRLCAQKEDGSLKKLEIFVDEIEAKKATRQYPALYSVNVYCVEERREGTLKRRWWLQHAAQHGLMTKKWVLEENPKQRQEAIDPPMCKIVLYYNTHQDRDHVVQGLCIDKKHHIWRKAAAYAAPPFTNWKTTEAVRVGDCDNKACEQFSDGEKAEPIGGRHQTHMRIPEEFAILIKSRGGTAQK